MNFHFCFGNLEGSESFLSSEERAETEGVAFLKTLFEQRLPESFQSDPHRRASTSTEDTNLQHYQAGPKA